jgi:two-component system response regulator PhoP
VLNAARVVSKTELTDHLYEQDYDRDSNVIEVFIGYCGKLDPDGARTPFIRCAIRLSFCLDPPG